MPLCGFQGLVHAGGGEPPVDVPVPTPQEVPESSPQVSVKESINQGVDEGVGVPQPEQSPLQPQRHAAAVDAADKRPSCRHQEEREPAKREGPNDDPEGPGRLLLPFEDGNVLSVLPQQFGEGGALLHRLGALGAVVAPAGGLQAVDALLFVVLGEIHEAVLLGAHLGGLVDPAVHDEHDGHGDVEGNPRGVDRVPEVLADEADPLHRDVLGPAEEGRKGDGGGQEPNDEDHLGHQLPVLSHRVRQRPGDPQIPGKRRVAKLRGRVAELRRVARHDRTWLALGDFHSSSAFPTPSQENFGLERE